MSHADLWLWLRLLWLRLLLCEGAQILLKRGECGGKMSTEVTQCQHPRFSVSLNHCEIF